MKSSKLLEVRQTQTGQVTRTRQRTWRLPERCKVRTARVAYVSAIPGEYADYIEQWLERVIPEMNILNERYGIGGSRLRNQE